MYGPDGRTLAEAGDRAAELVVTDLDEAAPAGTRRGLTMLRDLDRAAALPAKGSFMV
ncbi:hypothetical protein ACH4PW_11400 [Streptomyces sp. NPDC017082]|uniref:hypothetical protein n=1 Tax=Streptomyces sp. NPDC017082 TaxID=3364974 RepID=UPI0037BA5FC8